MSRERICRRRREGSHLNARAGKHSYITILMPTLIVSDPCGSDKPLGSAGRLPMCAESLPKGLAAIRVASESCNG